MKRDTIQMCIQLFVASASIVGERKSYWHLIF